MTPESILAKFDALNVWKRGDQRAPHKPLLVLFALARWQHGDAKISFEETAPTLLRFHGQPIKQPQRPEFIPHSRFTDWHQREVFKGQPRYLDDKNAITTS